MYISYITSHWKYLGLAVKKQKKKHSEYGFLIIFKKRESVKQMLEREDEKEEQGQERKKEKGKNSKITMFGRVT